MVGVGDYIPGVIIFRKKSYHFGNPRVKPTCVLKRDVIWQRKRVCTYESILSFASQIKNWLGPHSFTLPPTLLWSFCLLLIQCSVGLVETDYRKVGFVFQCICWLTCLAFPFNNWQPRKKHEKCLQLFQVSTSRHPMYVWKYPSCRYESCCQNKY